MKVITHKEKLHIQDNLSGRVRMSYVSQFVTVYSLNTTQKYIHTHPKCYIY